MTVSMSELTIESDCDLSLRDTDVAVSLMYCGSDSALRRVIPGCHPAPLRGCLALSPEITECIAAQHGDTGVSTEPSSDWESEGVKYNPHQKCENVSN